MGGAGNDTYFIDASGDADLAQAADLDSADVMDLVMEIEDRLDISIPVETMAQARSISPRRICPAASAITQGFRMSVLPGRPKALTRPLGGQRTK